MWGLVGAVVGEGGEGGGEELNDKIGVGQKEKAVCEVGVEMDAWDVCWKLHECGTMLYWD